MMGGQHWDEHVGVVGRWNCISGRKDCAVYTEALLRHLRFVMSSETGI